MVRVDFRGRFSASVSNLERKIRANVEKFFRQWKDKPDLKILVFRLETGCRSHELIKTIPPHKVRSGDESNRENGAHVPVMIPVEGKLGAICEICADGMNRAQLHTLLNRK